MAGLLAGWEGIHHTYLMGLPMMVAHRVNALAGIVLVAGTTLVFFSLIQAYERRLSEAATRLRERNEDLRALEEARDTRLLDLSRDLALTLADILMVCEEARHFPKTFDPLAALEKVEGRAGVLQAVIRSMIALRDQGDGLTERTPAILEEYERYRREHPRAARTLTDAEWAELRRCLERRGTVPPC